MREGQHVSARSRESDAAPRFAQPTALAAIPNRGAPTPIAPVTMATATRCGHQFGRLSVLPPSTTELTISRPGDASEREAEQVADRVMQKGEALESVAVSPATMVAQNAISRACSDAGHAPARTGSAALGALHPGSRPLVRDAVQTGGQALDAPTRTFMEQRFGHDFGHVRIHADDRASDSAVAVNARAYTAGHDIVFRAGQFNPKTTEGQHLLAHELTHVLQQKAAPSSTGTFDSSSLVLQRREVCDESGACRSEDENSSQAVPAANGQNACSMAPTSNATTVTDDRSTVDDPAVLAAGAHAPGGPYHPPEGVPLSCTALDDCSTLSTKINYLDHTIESHEQWDVNNPMSGYPNGRHAQEIAELRAASANCKGLYTTKCTGQPEYIPVPQEQQQGQEDNGTTQRVSRAALIGAGVGAGVGAVAGGLIGAVGGGLGGTLALPGGGTLAGAAGGGWAGAAYGSAVGGLAGGAIGAGGAALWEWLKH